MTDTTWETIRPAIRADVDAIEAAALAAATEVSVSAISHVVVTADMSSSTWNTEGQHEVFTVTGAVRMRIWIICKNTLTDAANLANIRFGTESDINGFIASTTADTIVAGGFWYSSTGTSAHAVYATSIIDRMIANGQDVGYRINGEALTGGKLEFHCTWEALDSAGNVAAGSGGNL